MIGWEQCSLSVAPVHLWVFQKLKLHSPKRLVQFGVKFGIDLHEWLVQFQLLKNSISAFELLQIVWLPLLLQNLQNLEFREKGNNKLSLKKRKNLITLDRTRYA